MVVSGNLSANSAFSVTQTQVITSNSAYTNNGTAATLSTEIAQLDQFSGGPPNLDTITINGINKDGSTYSGPDFTVTDANTTLGEFITAQHTVDLTLLLLTPTPRWESSSIT
ncbi:MAG: hypothetical protein ACYTFW_14040 [Planctomycetota bacterium]|jgi:hypothetical protein